MPKTQDCLAIVTGAAGTMGQAITRQLVSDGHRVAAVDLTTAMLATLVEEMPGRVIPVALDISDPDAVESSWNDLNRDHGPVQILVNNAGILTNNKAMETSPEEWRRVMAVNLDGPFYMSRLGLRDMRAAGWGRWGSSGPIRWACSMSTATPRNWRWSPTG